MGWESAIRLEETHMEPEKYWFVEENILPKVHFQVPSVRLVNRMPPSQCESCCKFYMDSTAESVHRCFLAMFWLLQNP